MRIITLLAAAALSLTGCIGAGMNSPIDPKGSGAFPVLAGIDLLGQQRALPEAFAGDLNIIALGFEREHQTPINSWIPIAESIMADHPSVKFYEVPIIYEMSMITRTWVNNGMRAGVPGDTARERTITVYTDRATFLETMKMNADRIYVLVLDKSGKIVWKTEGPTTQNSIKSLKAFIAKN
jgi:hypothetical protein